MNTVQYFASATGPTVQPLYPCNKIGDLVDVHLHGETHAVWTLQDNYEKHAEKCVKCGGKNPKITESELDLELAQTLNAFFTLVMIGAQNAKEL